MILGVQDNGIFVIMSIYYKMSDNVQQKYSQIIIEIFWCFEREDVTFGPQGHAGHDL